MNKRFQTSYQATRRGEPDDIFARLDAVANLLNATIAVVGSLALLLLVSAVVDTFWP